MIVIAGKLINVAYVAAAVPRPGHDQTSLLMADGSWIVLDQGFDAVSALLVGKANR